MTVSVTSNILQRTFLIGYKEEAGTCFTIDVQDRRYLITAKHIVDSIQDDAVVDIYHNKRWAQLDVRLVGHCAGNIDVTVLAPQTLFGASHKLEFTELFTLAEDIYFIGFPYDFRMEMRTDINADFPLPLVKKGIVSAIMPEDEEILLDGHNNPGFSGGPVVRRWTGKEQAVIGVVSGYETERQKVHDRDDEETSYIYETNTGIISAYCIRPALEIIEANPIGISVV